VPPSPTSPLDGARDGDWEALAELWRTHNPSVLRYLRARRAVSPDDVASHVWVDVATSIHRFEGGPEEFRRWLFTIAHRRSVDSIRRSVRRDAVSVRAADRVLTADDPETVHDRSASMERAVALIASLPDQMGAAVMLRIVNELPVADVAEILGTSEGNVRVLVHRGLQRLRRKLGVTHGETRAMRRVP
jgi:RNA polymerase sigma-70 factor (ECF subfamily)